MTEALAPAPARTTPAARRIPAAAWLTVFGLGAALRVFLFPPVRPLWTDEAMLASNIVTRSFAQLLQPLDFNQAAPVGFLLVERLVVGLFGPAELPLRLVPLLAGVLSVPLFALIARRILPDRRAAFAATLLFALSASLVYYSAEAKQYSTGVLAGLTVILVTLRQLDSRSTLHKLLVLLPVGLLALLLSHSAVFVLAACGLALLLAAIARRDRAGVVGLAAVGAAWLLEFGLLYALRYRRGIADIYLQEYWAAGFMPLNGGLLDWMRRSIWLAEDPGGFGLLPPWLVGGALLAGAACLLRANRVVALAVLGSVVLALVASAARVYPLAGRLSLHLVPVMLLALGALLSCAYRRSRWLGHAAAALLVLSVAWRLAEFRPPERIDARPAFTWLTASAAAGDVLIVIDDPLHTHYLSPGVAAYYHETSGLRSRGVRLEYREPTPHALSAAAAPRRTWLIHTPSVRLRAARTAPAVAIAERAFGPVRVARVR